MTISPSGATSPDDSRWRDVFAAGGEMGVRIADHDWATTPLGPVGSWPQSLRTAVAICLHSRFPILLWWGPKLVMLHNDAYLPILGAAKRDALGRPGAAVWPEIWQVIGPMLAGVLAGEGATWNQDQLLELDRDGFVEECYFTFSYSPIIDESGAPGGIFTAVTETTERVISDRRLRAVSGLAAGLVDAVEPEEVARRTVASLSGSPELPLVRLYLPGPDGLRLAGAGGDAVPDDVTRSWPLAEVLATGKTRLLPRDPAGDPTRPGTPVVALTPVPEPGGGEPSAVLVAGLNPGRPVDDGYRSFLALLAGHVGTALAGARAYQREHRRAEAAARAAQQHADQRFRTLVEASTAVVWTADATGAVIEPQPSWEAFTGQRWEEYRGGGWSTALHPEDWSRIEAAWRESLRVRAPLFEVEGRLWHAASDGYRHVAVRAASLRDPAGRISEWIGTIYDIEDRVVAEAAARRVAAISRALLDSAPVGVGLVDTDLRYLQVNPALARINGLPAEAHLGRRPSEALPTYDPRIEELMRRALERSPIVGAEFTAEPEQAGDGRRHFVASYFPIRIADTDELVGLGFTVVDVTERTRLLEALGAERARFERLAATDVLAVFGGEEARITEANEAFLAMLGYTAQDVVEGRLELPALTPPGWEEADARALAELRTTGRARTYDKEYRHADGHPVPVQIGVVALECQPLRWLAYATNLSAERATQAELRLFQALVERSGDFIAVAAPDGRTVYVNQAGREFVGLADGADVGDLRLLDFAAPEVREVWRRELIPAALRDGHHRAESRLVRLDTGAQLDVDHQTFTVTAGDERDITAFVATVARDISDRQRALRQAESLARLAGSLSSARGRAAMVEVVTSLVPAVVGASAVRVALAAPGSPSLEVAGGPEPEELPVTADAPLARAVRDDATVPLADGVGVCLPLRDGDGGVLGALEVRWEHPVADDEPRRTLLDATAGLCSQALRRAELTGSAVAMAEFAARLSVARSTREAIEVILSAAPAVLGAACPGLAMRDEGRRVRLWHDGAPATLAATFDDMTIDDPRPIARALRTGERIVLRNRAEFAARFPGLPDPVGAHGIVTTVALPLLDAQGRPIAALAFGWRREHPLREGDLALLDTIADLCEQTLERVRLAAAEHNLVTRLAGRLRTSAATIPAGLEITTRYQPAMSGMHLGGDWHDLIALDGDRLAVVVGDVVGHQVEAAADMAQLRTVLNTLIRTGVPLAEVFPRLTGLLGVGFLGTCLAMIVDPAAGEATVARVGHPHPVLVHPGRAPETVLTGNSLPLGLVRDPVPLTTVPFGPGALLVAYTDGLVERRDQPYDAGVAALHEVIVPVRDQPVEAIADAILTKLSGSEDDQALVVVRHVG
ncbi:PAS domain S-box protein [Micromonospora sp. DT47]|uniref:PAS domain S-box protein n=1 Tax=Micromonospora sp. DT47 TaxID=3393431 RepID=UPI003CF3EB7D